MIWLNILFNFWLLNFFIFSVCNESQKYYFGGVGPFEKIDESEGFPETEKFFKTYVELNKPLKMLGAANRSPALKLWTDDYFLSRNDLEGHYVTVEKAKLEDRKNGVQNITFLEFLRMYNSSDNYLVHELPRPLGSDMYLPSPLQCPEIYKNLLLENVMWMSSGDTYSVVHTDSVENILCMVRGTKHFVLVDPNKYSQQVLMEHPDEGYSDINVINVDYSKYKDLLDVSYHHVNLSAGDCLYVPFKWIHQVTSTGSNIAVNVWWDHLEAPINLTSCHHNPSATIADGVFKGVEEEEEVDFRSELVQLVEEQAGKVTYKGFCAIFLQEGEKLEDLSRSASNYLKKMFLLCDSNHDSSVTTDEIKSLSEKEWMEVELAYRLFGAEVERKAAGMTTSFKNNDEL